MFHFYNHTCLLILAEYFWFTLYIQTYNNLHKCWSITSFAQDIRMPFYLYINNIEDRKVTVCYKARFSRKRLPDFIFNRDTASCNMSRSMLNRNSWFDNKSRIRKGLVKVHRWPWLKLWNLASNKFSHKKEETRVSTIK